MSRRRGHSSSTQCTFPGCREWGYFEYATWREYAEGHDRRARWRCVRHTEPDEVLSLATPERSVRLTCVDAHNSRFWQQEGGRIGSGLQYGPGFKAYAEDFAPGAVLVVTARVEASQTVAQPPAGPSGSFCGTSPTEGDSK